MWGWLCVLMCYRIMYGIIYTFTKWCIFIVLSANLQTPLAPSQETFLSTLANPSSNMLNFSLPHRTVVWKEIFESLPRLQMFQESRKEIIKNISVTPLLTELLIYSDFSLPASSDHLGFWCLSCHSFVRRELGTLHIKCLWMHSLGRNPHYKIRLHKGHVRKVLACSRQEVCYGRLCWGGRNGYVDSWFFIRGGQRQRATSATKLERLSKRYGHSLELCSPHQAGLVEWSILKLSHWPRGNQVWKITRLQTPPSAGSPHHQCPGLEEAPGNQRAQHETTEEINPCKSFTYQDKADQVCTPAVLEQVVAAQHGSDAGLEMPCHNACMELAGTGLRGWPSPWITAEVSYSPDYILSPAACMSFDSSIPLLLSWALACCHRHRAPAMLSLHQPVLQSGWLDFTNTRLQTQFFSAVVNQLSSTGSDQ